MILVFTDLPFFTGSYIARRHSHSEEGADAILGGKKYSSMGFCFTMAATFGSGGGYQRECRSYL